MDCALKLLNVFLIVLPMFIGGCDGTGADSDANEMVLRHVLYTKLTGFDPIGKRDVYSLSVKSQIFETLYQYHYLKRPYQLVPLLADGMPEASEDRLRYTVKIKKGVRFQDDKCFASGKGRELRAGDFAYAIKRIADIKNLSPNWPYIDNKIVGLDEFREYTKTCKSRKDVDYSRSVEGLQSPDDYTFVVKLKRPWPQIVDNLMADISEVPMAKEAVDYYGRDIISHPVGTGPFMLKEWRRGSYIELVRNPNFRGEAYPSEGEPGDTEAGYLDDAGRIMPFADKVIWRIIEEYQPAWFLFLEGQVDGSPIPKDNFDEVMTGTGELTEKIKQRNIHLRKFLDPSTFWVGFNMQDVVLGKNKALRLAINRAIDRDKFIELFFNGRHMVAHGVIAPLMASYNPAIKEKGYAHYDPDEARAFLKEAEKVSGRQLPALKMAVPGTDTFSRQLGQFIARQLTEVGLEVEVEHMDGPTYWEKLNTRGLQMFLSGGSAGIPDAQDFLSSFYSRYWAPGANKFNYSNAEFDKLYEKTEVMSDSPERRKLYRKMELIVLEDCPAAFLNHRVSYALHHDWYKNYKPHVFQYGVSKYRRIDLAKRRAYKELLKKIE